MFCDVVSFSSAATISRPWRSVSHCPPCWPNRRTNFLPRGWRTATWRSTCPWALSHSSGRNIWPTTTPSGKHTESGDSKVTVKCWCLTAVMSAQQRVPVHLPWKENQGATSQSDKSVSLPCEWWWVQLHSLYWISRNPQGQKLHFL